MNEYERFIFQGNRCFTIFKQHWFSFQLPETELHFDLEAGRTSWIDKLMFKLQHQHLHICSCIDSPLHLIAFKHVCPILLYPQFLLTAPGRHLLSQNNRSPNLITSERPTDMYIIHGLRRRLQMQIYKSSTISDPNRLYRTRNICIGPEWLSRTRTCNLRNAKWLGSVL